MNDDIRRALHDAAGPGDARPFRQTTYDAVATGRRYRRRRTIFAAGGGSAAAAVAAVALVLGFGALGGSNGDPDGTEPPVASPETAQRPAIDVPPDDGFPHYEQRRLLYEVAWDHLDRSGEQLRWVRNVDSMNGYMVGTDLAWRVPGEGGLGLVRLGIGSSAMPDGLLRSEALCGGRATYDCEPRQLPDGGTAWVGQRGDLLGVAYRQPDGDAVWLVVNPLYKYASHPEPVSSVDITVEDALDYVADDRLHFLE